VHCAIWHAEHVAITLYGTEVLHRPTRAVTEFGPELAQLIDRMFEEMYAAEGVGLAANQIGVDLQVFVLDCPDAAGRRTVAHVVNPVLELPPPPRELDDDIEGCLSVPGRHAHVARPATASVTGVDKNGDPVRIDGTGMLARCLQHEYDHLQGRVYVDRLSARQRRAILTEAGLPTARP
jgi:peptide deformylase